MRNRFFLFAGWLALMLSCKGQNQPSQEPLVENPDARTMLWELSGPGIKQASFLYGTFHLMCPGDIRVSSALRSVCRQVDRIYMELDMDDPSAMLGMMAEMNMKDGKRLSDLLPEKEYDRLSVFFRDSLKMPFAMLQTAKPMILASLMYPKLSGCNASAGMETAIMKLAKENKKEIRGLETFAFQAALFDSIPYEEQARELMQMVDSMTQQKKNFDTMTAIYLRQDLDGLASLIEKPEYGLMQQQDLLLGQRNRNWVEQLKVLLPKERVLVAVGAGHLTGPDGLISLLRKEGYRVRAIKNRD
jgi:uncharacterized protein YbaP (TraB family)